MFAVPGARSQALDSQARSAASWPPGLALIIIGANDLTHFVHAAATAALSSRAS